MCVFDFWQWEVTNTKNVAIRTRFSIIGWAGAAEGKQHDHGHVSHLPQVADVRGTPYASDSCPSSASTSDSHLSSASAPATSSLFRNAFGRMTSYATHSRPASLPTHLPLMTRWHDTYAVPYMYLLILDLSLISIILYIRLHLQVDPYPFLFGSPARYVCD